MFGIRNTLKLGAVVFGLSALLLLAAPEFFLDLLLMPSDSAELVWAMRMIGITLVALAGNMWFNSRNPDDGAVRRVGVVMTIAATTLGALTLLLPAQLGWFAYLYAAVGFAFGANYLVCLLRKNI
jgi:O-antigen/teichoic acid export membrane protein